MTKNDLEFIASVINDYRAISREGSADPSRLIESLARDLADALRAKNKQFNRDKFLRACGFFAM